MKKTEILNEIDRLETIINQGRRNCISWSDSRDGSYEACLDSNGVYSAGVKLKNLKLLLEDKVDGQEQKVMVE